MTAIIPEEHIKVPQSANADKYEQDLEVEED